VPPPPADDQFLDEIERAIFLYFWEQASSTTGLVKDRAFAAGNDTRTLSSIAATGFGLTALCIADQRGYMASADIAARVQATLTFLLNQMPNQDGFFFHYVDMNTGQRANSSEVSSIDTAILLCGVLTCRQHFQDQQIADLATQLYQQVNWPWMLNGGATFSMGWLPESGFLTTRWDTYSELMMLYLLAIGATVNPIPASSWQAFARPSLTCSSTSTPTPGSTFATSRMPTPTTSTTPSLRLKPTCCSVCRSPVSFPIIRITCGASRLRIR
jgi:hypothetical protein